MAVYTRLDDRDLERFLGAYEVGALRDFRGISDGIENTNYFVTTSAGEYVLTIFETLDAGELPWFLELMAWHAEHGIPSAHPVADRNGRYLATLHGKPATLVTRLSGRSLTDPAAAHCHAVGAMIGRMHTRTAGFGRGRPNARGPAWWTATLAAIAQRLPPADRGIIEDEIAFQAGHRDAPLPRGIIHADLFRDNALFLDDRLTGIIDFYYACEDVLLYDLAVTANDWCGRPDGSLDPARVRALVSGYREERPFTDQEPAHWPVMLRAAALRFWLSRLHARHFPRRGEIGAAKDPDAFRAILADRRATAYSL